jgi:hypothetical protein
MGQVHPTPPDSASPQRIKTKDRKINTPEEYCVEIPKESYEVHLFDRK